MGSQTNSNMEITNEVSETKKDYYKTYLLINLVTEFKQVCI